MFTSRTYTRRAALALPAALLASSACARPQPPADDFHELSFFCLDTVCALGGVAGEAALASAQELCLRFEQALSRTIATSDVSRINAAAGAWVEVEPTTAELLEKALGYCELSGGLFDISIGAVTRLWDFHEGVVPNAQSVAEALPHVDWHLVELNGNLVRLADPQAALDLGGIAKGFIADKLLAHLAESGCESAYVNLGGNVAVLGAKADGTPWRLGVRDPAGQDESSVLATIPSSGGSLVTSGLYERSFEKDGRRYWHILDPATGYPVETSVVSASVYAISSLDADGLTKPLFFMDPPRGLDFVEAQGCRALIVTEDGERLASSGSGFVLV